MERTAEQVIIARARARTDTETPTPTHDHITDAYLSDVLTTAYKGLVDMVLAASGEAGIELFASLATIHAGTTELPDAVHRVVDLRRYDGRTWRPLPTSNWRTRHRGGSSDWPVYTIVQGKILFDPPDASPGELQLWYIPTLAEWADLDYLTVNGWDEYLVGYLSNEIAVKGDQPTGDHRDLMKDAKGRIMQAARDLKMGHTKTLAQVEAYAEDFFGRYY